MILRLIRTGWRQLVVLAAMLAFSFSIAQHLVYWQVTQHTPMVQAAAGIYDSQTNIPAKRGEIVDTSFVPLVTNVQAFELAADPTDTPHPRYNAAKLARVLRRDPGPILALLTLPHRRYVVIDRQIDSQTAAAVRALGLKGIILTASYRPVYTQRNLAAGVLGFVDAQGKGQYGLQRQYDTALRGRDGSQFIFRDTANRPLPVGVQKPRPVVDGDTLVLTIDSRIQAIVEQELAATLRRYQAQSATAIVMDPHTGAILAMASLPSYDPNHYNTVSNPALWDNLALQDYQPGSTFKLISVSAGLDSHSFTPQTTVYDPGFYRNYDITVRNWDNGGGWGMETPAIMIRHSANVGMAQFANMIGPMKFYRYLTGNFGFGKPTGIDLPNESAGLVRTPSSGQEWQLMDLLTNSYGQGIDVTPLQLTAAVGALANGGWRMRPYIVKSRFHPGQNAPYWTAQPRRATQAVSAATAAQMTSVLQDASNDGGAEATCAMTKDYPVAAKTGTATIEGPAAFGLNLSQGTVASLIGWAPTNDPKFVMLITVKHPQPGPKNNDIWGSVVAAPAWHDIAENLYRLMGISPQPGSTPPKLPQWQGSGQGGWACGYLSR